MEHFKNDNDVGGDSSKEESKTVDEYTLYSADPSPPYDKDLLDIMHK